MRAGGSSSLKQTRATDPLTIVERALALARREDRSTQELRDAVYSAAEQVDRLVRIAEDLLRLCDLTWAACRFAATAEVSADRRDRAVAFASSARR